MAGGTFLPVWPQGTEVQRLRACVSKCYMAEATNTWEKLALFTDT